MRRMRVAGLGLMEILVVIALLAMLSVLALPALHRVWQQQQLRLAAAALERGLRLARAESLNRGLAVALCPSADGRRCTADGAWEQGWVALPEPLPGRYGPQPLLVEQAWSGLTIRTSANFGGALHFTAEGWLRAPGGAPAFGHITLCGRDGGPGRQIEISRAGRARQLGVDCAPAA